jgi:gliding motility-associated-like protein
MAQTAHYYILLCWTLMSSLSVANAQQVEVPEIHFIQPAQSGVYGEVKIWGKHFPEDIAQLKVWFGAAQAKVLASDSNYVVAKAPLAATYEQVTVQDLSSGLQAHSDKRFMLSFGGEAFSQARFMGEPYSVNGESGISSLKIVDLDGDSIPEVVTANKLSVSFSVFKNQSSPQTLDLRNEPFSNLARAALYVNAADLDGDGLQDLIFFNADGNSNDVIFLRNQSTPDNVIFGSRVTITTPSRLKSANVYDLNRDGKPELILSSSSENVLRVFENISTPGSIAFNNQNLGKDVELFIDPSQPIGAASIGTIEVADLNNDQLPDLIVNSYLKDQVYIFRNESADGNLYFSDVLAVPFKGTGIELKAGDINGDQKPDLVVSDYAGNKVYVATNASLASEIAFNSYQSFSVFNAPYGVELADLDGDGKLDILLSSEEVQQIMYLRNISTESGLSFEPYNFPINTNSLSFKIGDINQDGKADIAFTSITRQQLTIIPNGLCYEAQILAEPSMTVCSDVGYKLYAKQGIGVTYDWKINGVSRQSGSQPFIEITEGGIYTLTLKNTISGCESTSEAVEINYIAPGNTPQVPQVNGITELCYGDALFLEADQQANVNYLWEGPDGFTAQQASIQIDNMTPEKAGVYSLTVTSDEGCTSEVREIPVTVTSPPVLSINYSGETTFCTQGTIDMSVRSLEGFSYQWLKDGQPIEGETSTTFQATETGEFSVLTIDPDSCTRESETVPVLIYPELNPVFEAPQKACLGQSISFANQTTGMGDYTPVYNWDFGDGTTANVSDPQHTYQQAGTFNVTLTVSYDGQCAQEVSKSIQIDDTTPPQILIDWQGQCVGDSAVLSLDKSYTTYEWSTGETTAQIKVKESGLYSVVATTDAGCEVSSAVQVEFGALPELSVSAESDTILIGKTTQLFAEGADSYQWTPAESLNDDQSFAPLANPTQTTTYTLTGYTERGCVDTVKFTLYVISEKDIEVLPSKVLTPNGDNIYDTWIIKNLEFFDTNLLRIFDKSGREIFRVSDYQNDFDGMVKGRALEEDAYYYILQYGDGNVQKGSFVLLR